MFVLKFYIKNTVTIALMVSITGCSPIRGKIKAEDQIITVKNDKASSSLQTKSTGKECEENRIIDYLEPFKTIPGAKDLYVSILKTILDQRSKKSVETIINGDTAGLNLLNELTLAKKWYITNCKIESLRDVKNAKIKVESTMAIHTEKEVFINSDLFYPLSEEEKGRSLLRELVTSYYMTRFSSVVEICNLYLGLYCPYESEIPDHLQSVFVENKFSKFNENDWKNINDVTEILWSQRKRLNLLDLEKVFTENSFDQRFFIISKNLVENSPFDFSVLKEVENQLVPMIREVAKIENKIGLTEEESILQGYMGKKWSRLKGNQLFLKRSDLTYWSIDSRAIHSPFSVIIKGSEYDQIKNEEEKAKFLFQEILFSYFLLFKNGSTKKNLIPGEKYDGKIFKKLAEEIWTKKGALTEEDYKTLLKKLDSIEKF